MSVASMSKDRAACMRSAFTVSVERTPVAIFGKRAHAGRAKRDEECAFCPANAIAAAPNTHRNDTSQRVGDAEHGRLILLQILVVRRWQALERDEEAGAAAKYRARLAADELERVRILLLRHEGAPRAE